MTRINPATIGELSWQVARRCNGGECVRIAAAGGQVLIGDSKDPDGPVLYYSPTEWKAFVEGIRHGDFDNLL